MGFIRSRVTTAGLRGKVGAGPNRMNRLVIQETATGLGNYLLTTVKDAKKRGVVIGIDGCTIGIIILIAQHGE